MKIDMMMLRAKKNHQVIQFDALAMCSCYWLTVTNFLRIKNENQIKKTVKNVCLIEQEICVVYSHLIIIDHLHRY